MTQILHLSPRATPADMPPHAAMFTRVAQAGLGVSVVTSAADPWPFIADLLGRLVIFGDDPGEQAFGPAGFHEESLLLALRRADAIAFISCEANVGGGAIYEGSALMVLRQRKRIAIIETNHTKESAWLEFLREQNIRPKIVATVKPEAAR